MAEGANSPKGEFLSIVTVLKPDLIEFGHQLNQSGQAWHHHWLILFVFDEWGKQKLVHPLRLNMHIHQEPFFL
jgi:hypothetical protein